MTSVEKSGIEEIRVTWFSWAVAFLALLTYAVSFISRNVWATAIPVAAPALHLSMAAAGGLMTAFYIGYVVSNFLTGPLVDIIGPRKTLALATLCTGLFTLLIPFAPSYAVIFLLRVGAGAASGPLFAGGVKYQHAWFPKKARATAMGFVMTGPALGMAIASGAFAPLIKNKGWQAGFMWAGIICLVVAVAVLLFANEGTAKVDRSKSVEKLSAEAKQSRSREFRALIGKRSFILGCIACLLSIGAGQGFTTWIIAYFTKVQGFTLAAAGAIFAGANIVRLFGGTFAGVVSDLLKARKKACYVGAVVVASTIVALALVTNTTLLWALMLIEGIMLPFIGMPLNTLQADAVEGPLAGSAMGFYNGVAQLGSVIFPIGLGFVLDVTKGNYFVVLMTIAATYIATALLIAGMDEKPAVSEKPKATA